VSAAESSSAPYHCHCHSACCSTVSALHSPGDELVVNVLLRGVQELQHLSLTHSLAHSADLLVGDRLAQALNTATDQLLRLIMTATHKPSS
jgi:hypothetical protein